ncbi:MAG: hypothetical protein ACTHK1_08000 [Actinomycetales bacterium]
MSGAPRRTPVPPDQATRERYETALSEKCPVELQDWPVVIHPPRGTRATWRVLYTTPAGRGELSGGRSLDQLHAAVLAAVETVRRRTQPRAESSVATLIEDYLQQHLAGGWDTTTFNDRRRDLAGLRRETEGVVCADLDVEHLRKGVQSAGTSKRGKFLKNRYRHLLTWGERHDYVRPEQVAMCDKAEWRAPDGWKEPKPLKDLARLAGTSRSAVPRGSVLTFAQVNAWATACGEIDAHSEGLVQTFAATGLRFSEGIMLTADPAVADARLGNLVDLTAWEVQVRWQTSEEGGRSSELPKADKVRDVVIPSRGKNPTGFDLRAWLGARGEAALKEQKAGTNPLALYFPSPEGQVWWHSNLRGKVWVRALAKFADDWAPVTTITHANGRTRRHQRFTLHSLRDRYACTAVDNWHYTKAELFAQGGWEDMATVERYYYGTTDKTHEQVRAKLEESPTAIPAAATHPDPPAAPPGSPADPRRSAHPEAGSRGRSG